MSAERPHALSRKKDFPDEFLWGAATSAYQVEGGWDQGGREPSIWDIFSHTAGNTLNGDSGDDAVDHYHRYAEDIALMADLGVNAYRFSISWSRLMSDGAGEVNPEGAEFYRNLCSGLAEEGITPAATLYHWDLPQAIQDRGGWLNPDVVGWFTEYARTAKETLGDLITLWATLNEPWCTAFLGHSAGEHAPGMKDPGSAYVAAHHLMLAHHSAIRAMRETRPRGDDRLGIVLNLIPAWPADESKKAATAAAGVDAIQNRLFLESLFDGRYPDEILGHHRRYGVTDRIDLGLLADAVEPIDYLGVNYYNVNRITFEQGGESMPAWPGPVGAGVAVPPGPLDEMGWAAEPEGLQWMLKRVGDLQPRLPLIVMENGAAFRDVVDREGRVNDVERIDYISRHIAAIHDARKAGVDVTGYFVWSLMDNFEWARGYSKQFGIIRVDRTTMERTVKQSGHWYREFLAS